MPRYFCEAITRFNPNIVPSTIYIDHILRVCILFWCRTGSEVTPFPGGAVEIDEETIV